MNKEINYKSNPLNGVCLKEMLVDIVEHYGFEILFACLNINCFKTNPSIDSSVKFLKKTVWAREKVEAFYLYEFKNLPRASSEQFLLPPRDRIVPENQMPGEPAVLSLEDAKRLREKRKKKSAAQGQGAEYRHGPGKSVGTDQGEHSNNLTRKDDCESSNSPSASVESDIDPWAKWKSRSER